MLSNRVWRSAFESREGRCRHRSAAFVVIRSHDMQCLTFEAFAGQEKRFLAVYSPHPLRSIFSIFSSPPPVMNGLRVPFPTSLIVWPLLMRICLRKWVMLVAETSSSSDDGNNEAAVWWRFRRNRLLIKWRSLSTRAPAAFPEEHIKAIKHLEKCLMSVAILILLFRLGAGSRMAVRQFG